MSSMSGQGSTAESETSEPDTLIEALRAHFGFSSFQLGQREVVSSVLSRRPTLAVMPTGAGKSLCYQLPALMSEGLTLVVSPLISLMKDQVDGLRAKGVRAYCLNSSLSTAEHYEVMSAVESGSCDLLYVAPERFRNSQFLSLMSQLQIALVAVDEAHCISQWGHDFRPEYAKLGEHLAQLDYEMLIACTATATPVVQRDILKVLKLSLDEVAVHVAGFLRQNLYLEARLCRSKVERQGILKAYLKDSEGAVIVYANTQRLVEEYAEFCAGVLGEDQVCGYHGGMSERIRTQAQDRFMSGEARVVVATNAFGMGVDRADVRAVIHVEIPRTVEAYYQEVGRAGRDGEPAQCLLLYGAGDRRTHEFLINQSHPDPRAFLKVWGSLAEGPKTPDELQRALKPVSQHAKADVIIRYLSKERLVSYSPQEDLVEVSERGLATSALSEALNLDAIAEHRDHQLRMHDEMYRLAQSGDCRHAYLLSYFGEDRLERCPPEASCDRCGESPFQQTDDGLATGELTDIERNITLKALSGISRAKGYYGAHKVVAMLSGVARSGAETTFLAKLSTWGVLSPLGFEGCLELVNYLMGQGLCEMRQKLRANGQLSQHKSLQITPLGLSVCLGKREPNFRLKQVWLDQERRGARLPPSLPQSARRSRGGAPPEAPAPKTSSSASGSQASGWRSGTKGEAQAQPSAQSTGQRGSTQQSWSELVGSRRPADSTGGWRAHVPANEPAKAPTKAPTKASNKASNKPPAQDEEPQVGRGLSVALKQYRLRRSRELQVPAYTIFSDATLERIVSAAPRSREALLAIKGVGPRTWAQFGLEILEIIREQG